MAKALLLLMFLVTVTVAVPVIAAFLVHRDAPVVGFVRRRIRVIWCLVAVGWAALALVHFSSSGSYATFWGWGALLCSALHVGLAFVYRATPGKAGESSSYRRAA